eukprot:CAMPEP_0197030212 /NCGR_PEP_ID=MMETSP1384-20130603/9490_1 /TAXON_ID=29189 /ORGANISM="Ammonia sp." /LENGTH=148 /DNA_ID=CAMNT_0042459511 /DNA_START=83 /DNA_END=529 /DNA_ORIENTATION=+
MQIKYTVKQSTIPDAGKGIFTEQFIAKGTVVWKEDWDNLVIYTRKGLDKWLASLPYEQACEYALHIHRYPILGYDRCVYELDESHYMNHSEGAMANIGSRNHDCYALRDIQPGEELLCNYNEFDDADWVQVYKDKYKVWGPHLTKSKL